MAKPFVLFENILGDGTLTVTDANVSYPIANVLDWRMSTPFRWKGNDTASPKYIHLDLGVGNTAQPDALIVGGHNWADAMPNDGYTLQWSDNDADWTNAAAEAIPADNMPFLVAFTVGAAHRYWRVRIQDTGGFEAIPEAGVVTLGRRLTWEEGAQASLDPYGFETMTEPNMNEHGAWVGANVRYISKRFLLQHESPGMSKTGFYQPSTGLTFDGDFTTHVQGGFPFWFVWDFAAEPTHVYLCTTVGLRTPPMGSLNRRSLFAEFIGYREVA